VVCKFRERIRIWHGHRGIDILANAIVRPSSLPLVLDLLTAQSLHPHLFECIFHDRVVLI